MTPPNDRNALIRRLWDENQRSISTAAIAEVLDMQEAHVSKVVSKHVARKARARKQAARAEGGASRPPATPPRLRHGFVLAVAVCALLYAFL